ncbi:hypothetical protein DID77_02795, partial [Candidatus Marinamargulisbacteria bacterium SCGC AG-439-L15]
ILYKACNAGKIEMVKAMVESFSADEAKAPIKRKKSHVVRTSWTLKKYIDRLENRMVKNPANTETLAAIRAKLGISKVDGGTESGESEI